MSIKKGLPAILLCMALTLAGCTTSANSVPESTLPNPTDPYYSVSSGWNLRFRFDEKGEDFPESVEFETICDALTNEPKYIAGIRYTMEDNPNPTHYEGRYTILANSTLFDLEGNVLIPETAVCYGAAFGDLLIRCSEPSYAIRSDTLPDGYFSQLFNIKTGETVIEGAATLTPLAKNSTEAGHLAVCDGIDKLMGVIDRDGNKVSGFPSPKSYNNPEAIDSSCFLVSNALPDGNTDGNVVLDLNLNPLFSSDSISVGHSLQNILSGYLVCADKATAGKRQSLCISLQGFETAMTPPYAYTVDYFDGELAVMQSPDDHTASLYTISGTKLSGDYSRIMLPREISTELAEPAQSFIGIRYHEGIDLLDRRGNVVQSASIPNITGLTYINDNLYTYSYNRTVHGTLISSYGLLDADFAITLPADEYSYIYQLQEEDCPRKKLPILRCSKEIHGATRYTLTDLEGKLIMDNLSGVGTATKDYIAVVKGNYYGLIDYNGNWILKKSIYKDFADK